MGLVDHAGARLTAKPEEADVLVVNTCSFIDTAKQESVDTILEMVRLKTEGRAKKVVVAGCLVERYRDEIRKSIPEVDAVVGTGELESILEAVEPFLSECSWLPLCVPAPASRPSRTAAFLLPLRILNGDGAADTAGVIPAASRINSSSPVPTTASTSGMFLRISSR